MHLFSLIFLLLAILYIVYNYRLFTKNPSLFSLTNIAIVVTNGLGIPFVKYLDSERYFIVDSEDISSTGLMVIFIFMIISFSVKILLVVKKRASFNEKTKYNFRSSTEVNKLFKSPSLFFWFLLIISFLSFARFFFLSGGMLYLGSIINFSTSNYEYYMNRVFIGKEILALQGSVLAFLSVSYINPVLMISFVLLDFYGYKSKKRNRFLSIKKMFYWALILYLSLSTILISLIFAKRFMMIYGILFPFFIITNYFSKDHIKEGTPLLKKSPVSFNKRNLVKIILIVFFILFVFSFTSQKNLTDSSTDFVQRVSVMPPLTNNYYYNIFPSQIDYRGLENIGKMGAEGSGDVSYYDIGELTTGKYFVPNANFLTIAYSGAGFLGVSLITIVYCFVCVFHDFLLDKLSSSFKYYAMIANINGIMGITNTPLQSAIYTYGFVLSTVLLLFCLNPKPLKLDLLKFSFCTFLLLTLMLSLVKSIW